MNGVGPRGLYPNVDCGRNDLYQVSRLSELISVEKFGGGRTRTIYVDWLDLSRLPWVTVGVAQVRRLARKSNDNWSLGSIGESWRLEVRMGCKEFSC